MENTNFSELQKAIQKRRTTGWAKMNGNIIPNQTMNDILALADWAPTHGRTEPWRFNVYTGESMKEFSKKHAELYWNNTAEDKRTEATRERLETCTDKVSHIAVAIMQRGANPKIPVVEEIAATSAAVQNILLGATACGVASFWSTGGMVLNPAFKENLNLKEEDVVLGLLFFGYTDEPAKEGVRNVPMAEKIKWM